jgi:plastocyanin
LTARGRKWPVVLMGVLALGLGFISHAYAQAAAVRIVEGSTSDINSWGYAPPSITVQAGQGVTFTNTGSQAHTATAAGAFDTGLIAIGASATVSVDTPGTYAYQCTPHPWMKGTLIVSAAAAAPAAPAPAAPAPAAPAPAAPAPPPVAAPPAVAPAPAQLPGRRTNCAAQVPRHCRAPRCTRLQRILARPHGDRAATGRRWRSVASHDGAAAMTEYRSARGFS